MERKQTPTSVKVIYWITQSLFWLFSAAGLFAIFFGLGLTLHLIHDVKLNIGLPVEASVVESGSFNYGEESTNVQLKQMIGKIEFKNAPPQVQRIYGVFMIIVLSITFYLFLTFRKFITQVYHGLYFDKQNIMLLKRIAYGLLGLWVFILFYGYFQYFFIIKNLEMNSVVFHGKIETYPGVLLFSLIVWVLSHIFQKGVEIEKENELTI